MNNDLNSKIKHALSAHGNIESFRIIDEIKLITSTITKLKVSYRTGNMLVYLKKYKASNGRALSPDVGRHEYESLKKLHSRFKGHKGLHVVRPIAYLPEEQLLITEAFEGKSLSELMLSHLRGWSFGERKKKIEQHIYMSGEWLKSFQSDTLQEASVPLSHMEFFASVKEMLKVLNRFGLQGIFETTALERIEEGLGRIAGETVNHVGCHNDFTPQNILVNKGELAVIDFARFATDSNYEDLALFIVALEGYKSIIGISKGKVEILKEAFVRGYGMNTVSRPILHLYIIKNVIKVLTWISPESTEQPNFLHTLSSKSQKKRRLQVYFQYMDWLYHNPSGI